ncbi:MAG: hypothetical protein N3G20_01660 [Verrucomicrobiae bacterium]|nr:hypothetical protein [Verrucomicrobiae bacterium]
MGSKLPRLAVRLVCVAIAALAAAGAYTVWLNPEIRFYLYAARLKQAWADKLHREFGRAIIVFGASSCAFAIDGERMVEKHGLPVVNFGMHAGMEPLFLTALAVESTRPGDTLVVALEPGLLLSPFDSPDLAAQMGMALGKPRLIHASDLTGEPVHWVKNILSLRPGAYHFFTLLGKIVLGKPLYRYSPQDLRPSGFQQTTERREIRDQEPFIVHALPSHSEQLLSALARWCRTNNVELFYSLPWGWVSEAKLNQFKAMNASFLIQVAKFMPVLKDPTLGAYPVREHFADTEWHLTAEGAANRTDALAQQLKARVCWTIEELDQVGRTASVLQFSGKSAATQTVP